MNIDTLIYWAKEREAIRLKKEAGKPKPWTEDMILRSYRFCCLRREDDKVTQWITDNWRVPHDNDPHLWFAMTVSRLINWPDTLEMLGYPVPWKPKKFVDVIHSIQESDGKAYSGVYIVSTNGRQMDKAEYLAEQVLTPLWEDRKRLSHRPETLEKFHDALTAYQGIGGFIGAQVIADVKYSTPFKQVPDWWTWAASGPGSRRGLNRLLGRPLLQAWNEHEWHRELLKVKSQLDPLLKKAKLPALHAQDIQSLFCETDKYERVRLGEGYPRNNYPGGPE